MIEVKNITKSYGNKKVVDNVSLNIQEGKITSFIGPNGAGKSTLLFHIEFFHLNSLLLPSLSLL